MDYDSSNDEKCSLCNKYLCDEGSDYCAPCNFELSARKAYRDASGTCQECVRDHFEGTKGEVPARRFGDPMCNQANPWCLYYEAMLKVISTSMPTTALMLSRIRSIMKERKERKGQYYQ